MVEKRIRSVAKTVSWRILASLTTLILVFIVTRNLQLTLGVGLLDALIKTLIYFMHERAWNKIHWGRNIKKKTI